MTQFPYDKKLPVHLLSSCFNKTTATYKFYWFLSMIQAVEEGKTVIRKKDLFARMIANSWYTINYYNISFGMQDKLQRAIKSIINYEPLTIDDKRENIVSTLINSRHKETISQLKYFNTHVPHWFLSPWFPGKDKSEIYKASKDFKNNCICALKKDTIEINKNWVDYLTKNSKILKDFCYWNLVVFLQTKNPSIPDIPNKLIRPAERNSLVSQRKKFWDIVIKELGYVDCIYTNKRLKIGDYAVEHFVPYSFVSHDLIWNLIPADNGFNSHKSNKLPQLDIFFDSFYEIQKLGIEIVQHKTPNNKFLEDYLTIFPSINEMSKNKFKETIQPLITIASNNGFEYLPMGEILIDLQ